MGSRHERRTQSARQAAQGMMTRAASVTSRGRTDAEGLSIRRRWAGREFTKAVAEIGERALCAPASSASKDKFDIK